MIAADVNFYDNNKKSNAFVCEMSLKMSCEILFSSDLKIGIEKEISTYEYNSN